VPNGSLEQRDAVIGFLGLDQNLKGGANAGRRFLVLRKVPIPDNLGVEVRLGRTGWVGRCGVPRLFLPGLRLIVLGAEPGR